MLKIIPLGGLGEIGLNMMIFEYAGSMFVVDSGLMFPEDYMLGVDYVVPNMDYLKANREKVMGVVLTHGHEDHIGGIPHLLKEVPAPIFGTPFTLGLVRNKLIEHDLLYLTHMHEIRSGEKLRFGPFMLEFISVTHSVVDGVGLAIKTPVGTIIHTGDFKIGHGAGGMMTTDVGRFAQYGQEGVLALMSDSTNVEKEGYTLSGADIKETLANIITESPGRVIVALFASNIMRIQKIVDIAEATGRKIVISGRSIENSVEIAKKLGHLRLPDEISIDIEEVGSFPDEEVVIITTGSQGEPMSALNRMSSGNHKQIGIKTQDTVILSSKFIPGNERAINSIVNNLYRRGANVIYEKISAIHVSGHAFREELKLMINLTRPQYFIPIHGEYRHLVLHGRLAQEMGIPKERILLVENGQTILFDSSGGRIDTSVPTGRVLIDGKGVGDVGRSVLKERRDLSEEGIVAVTLAFDEETGIVVYGPEIESRGFIFETLTGHLLDDAICVILEIIEELGPEIPNRIEKIRNKTQTALRQYFNFTIKRRPVILPFIMEI